jgi:hypothetical protein
MTLENHLNKDVIRIVYPMAAINPLFLSGEIGIRYSKMPLAAHFRRFNPKNLLKRAYSCYLRVIFVLNWDNICGLCKPP